MPKLLLKESPCTFCRFLEEDVEELFSSAEGHGEDAVIEGSLSVTSEFCYSVPDLDEFYDHRFGVSVDGETRFPWCAWHRRRRDA